jgi:AmmeMemoRadiSam system protein B
MSLVFAAITPHPPLLIPAIGKDQLDKIEKTKKAMEKLEEEIYTRKPQVIIIISPHSSLFKNSFSINAHTNFESSFEEFGDLSTKKEWQGAPDIAVKITHMSGNLNLPTQLVSQEKLDHGASIPLFYLTKHLDKHVKILPVGYSHMNAMEHIRFGEILKEAVMSNNKRVAIIASGDLSHNLNKVSPYKENLDERIRNLLKNKAIGNMLELDGSDLLKESNECGYRSILILLGIIKEMDYKFEEYSYEHPFGVGYLAGNFDF